MTSTLFASFGMLAPVHGFLRKFGMPKTLSPARLAASDIGSAAQSSYSPSFSTALPVSPRNKPAVANPQQVPFNRNRVTACSRNRAHWPLRIVRVMEVDQASSPGERLMISGRMADVCAELDRMAEREANPRT